MSAAQLEVSHDVSEEDRRYMRQALELAKRGLGKTYPNPAVGCVIVKDSQVSEAVTGCIANHVHVTTQVGLSVPRGMQSDVDCARGRL